MRRRREIQKPITTRRNVIVLFFKQEVATRRVGKRKPRIKQSTLKHKLVFKTTAVRTCDKPTETIT